MIDGGEVDDKIIVVLCEDEVYGVWCDIIDILEIVVNCLKYYFLIYKQLFGEELKCEIIYIYGCLEVIEVIKVSMCDYNKVYGNLEEVFLFIFFEVFNFSNWQQNMLNDLD